MLLRRARCVFSRLRCNRHSLLLSSNLSRIGRIENPSCSVCGHSYQNTSHLILQCLATDSAPLTLWQLSVSLRPLVHTLGSCPASGALWSSAMPPSLERGWESNDDERPFFKSKLCIVYRPVQKNEIWRKTMESQKPGNYQSFEPEVFIY